jgi:hypothetical protein
VRWATARSDRILDDSQCDAVTAAAAARGGRCTWRSSARCGRSYALLELPDDAVAPLSAAAAANGAIVYESPVIALAVFPAVKEALPPLLGALGGAGRPAGVLRCDACGGNGIAVEGDLERTPAAVVLGLVDVELARFASGRTVELLTPLPPAWRARIASDGLRAPEISSDRLLEALVKRAELRA